MKRTAIILAIIFAMTACANTTPKPPGTNTPNIPNINRSQIDVWVDGYTVHSSCDGQGHRVYRMGDSIAVSPDEKCGAQ